MASYTFVLAFLASLMVSAAALIRAQDPAGFTLTPKRDSSAMGNTLGVIGNVNDVLLGTVTDTCRNHYYSASDFLLGFGACTPSPYNLTAMGESFLYNGQDYTLSTDPDNNYYQPINGASYRTQFTVGLHSSAVTDMDVSYTRPVDATQNFTLSNLYTTIAQHTNGRPFCLYGDIKYVSFQSVSIAKAPIYGENINSGQPARNSYYTKPTFNIPDAITMTMGCAANYSSIDSALEASFKTVLYYNSYDTQNPSAPFQTHAHAITFSDATKSAVTGVYHMVVTSIIDTASIKVFVINNVQNETPVVNAAAGSAASFAGLVACVLAAIFAFLL